MATLANQGVTDTLRITLIGNNAFVIAYAVASLWLGQLQRARTVSYNAVCNTEADILNNNPGPSFTPSPPPISPGLTLFTQPPLLSEIVAEFFDPVTDPLPFADEWRHPFCVVKRRR